MSSVESFVPPEVVWYFQNQTEKKEPHAIGVNHLSSFSNGVAEFTPGLHELVDIAGEFLIPNYKEDFVIQESGIVIPALISERRRIAAEQFHEQRDKTPIIVLAPHPSIATPYITVRTLNQPFSSEVAQKFYSTVGPRPMLFDYAVAGETFSPFDLGVGLNNLLLTGTNTGSVDDAPDTVKDWLKKQGDIFKNNLNEIMEPKAQGDNNVLIVCPSGRIADYDAQGFMTEYRPRSYKFAARKADGTVFWPIGVYDTLLRSPKNPTSLVHFHPDISGHSVDSNEPDDRQNELFNLHLLALALSTSELGSIEMQTRLSASGKRFGKQVLQLAKRARPNLSTRAGGSAIDS